MLRAEKLFTRDGRRFINIHLTQYFMRCNAEELAHLAQTAINPQFNSSINKYPENIANIIDILRCRRNTFYVK